MYNFSGTQRTTWSNLRYRCPGNVGLRGSNTNFKTKGCGIHEYRWCNSSVCHWHILIFQVEMFSCDENVGWVTLVRRLHSTHYTQSFLKPGQSYLFVVRAENSHGLSAPSHLSNRISLPTEYRQSVSFSHDMSIAKSTLFGGHIVDLIDIKTVSSTSIKLFWEVRV